MALSYAGTDRSLRIRSSVETAYCGNNAASSMDKGPSSGKASIYCQASRNALGNPWALRLAPGLIAGRRCDARISRLLKYLTLKRASASAAQWFQPFGLVFDILQAHLRLNSIRPGACCTPFGLILRPADAPVPANAAHQVVGCHVQHEHLIDLLEPAHHHLPHLTDGLGPSKPLI